ncbi:MAG: haloacid dehalogenase type II [Gammaproteobacteria bacterium]|nr:haloacid dehalogenase type II [Gammaproteobacteria bacterium]
MNTTLAFDIYGTLIDTHGVVTALRQHVGDQAPHFSQIWRDKQLEYSFRRGLMQVYQDFSVCTRQALDYVCQRLQVDIPIQDRQVLMDSYRLLPAFDDVSGGLERLHVAGHKMVAFSNGSNADVRQLLEHAGLMVHLDGIISVDEISSFKPDPAVYAHFLKQTQTQIENVWLISSNPFDVIGAHAVGWRTVWVRRDTKTVFDPWGVEPSAVVSHLSELIDIVSKP